MSELLAGTILRPVARQLPSLRVRPEPARALSERDASVGGPGRSRRLRGASRAIGGVMARLWPEPGEARPPVLTPGPWDVPDSLTPGPAGWFTLAVEAEPSGFRLAGRLLDAAELARAIWHCPWWRGRPVLLVTQPSAPADGAGPVLARLSTDLGAPVYVSDGGIRFTCGRAVADRLFWCFRPGTGNGEPEPVDRVLPPLGPVLGRPGTTPHPATGIAGAAPVPAAPAAGPGAAPQPGVLPLAVPQVEVPRPDLGVRQVSLPGEGNLPLPDLDIRRPRGADPAGSAGRGIDPAGAVPAGVLARPSAAPVPAVPVPAVPVPAGRVPDGVPAEEPSWSAVPERTEEADRERLRDVLGWRFQAHSRTVARAMSLHPGLRDAVGPHDVLAGLIAVLTLLDGGDERVNAALRGGSAPEGDVPLLARCARAGLAQLPVVGGPVFATAPAGPGTLDLYRPGGLVVEPAFTRVALAPSAGPAPRYAIWSATARRLDQLCPPGERAGGGSGAMFAAGSRFAVLGVDDTGPDGAPWVLLRELVPDRPDSALDERVTRRLRAALGSHPDPVAPPEPLPWPLGIAPGNRRFPARPGPSPEGRPVPPSRPGGDGRDRPRRREP